MNFREYLNDLSETALSPKELQKYNRLELFADKIKSGSEFELINGKKVIVLDIKDNFEMLELIKNDKKVNKFKTNIGDLSPSQFLKTKEFGGGSGSGGGYENTSLNESAQCLYCSLIFNVLNYEIQDEILDEDLEKAYKYIDCTETLENLKNLKPEWIKSSIKIANALFHKYKFNEKITFHRGSEFMKKIYNIKNLLMKNEYGQILKDDKWNPGDIWLSTNKGLNIIQKKYNNLEEYNNEIKNLFLSKDLISISLKKVTNNVPIKLYNIENEYINDKLKNIQISSTGGFFNSIDCYFISENEQKIQFRSFNGTSGWQAEIKGVNANGGKMSIGPINILLKQLNLRTLSESSEISKLSKKPTDEFYKKFHNLYKKHSPDNSLNLIEFINTIDSMNNEKNYDYTFRYSKYLCLELIDIVKNSGKENEFINGVLKYSSSNTNLSSAFIKIGN